MNATKYKQLADIVTRPCDPRQRQQQIVDETRTFLASYTILGVMCHSANGTLLAGLQLATRRQVVIKLISKTGDKHMIDNRPLPLEIAMHLRVNGASDYINELIEWYERRDDFVIILDFCPRRLNLVEYVAIFGPLSTEASLSVARQLAMAADDMFRFGVCHRDLKHENVLIDYKTLKVKIIDFGCATLVRSRHQKLTSFSGTVEFTPPEYYAYGHCEAEKSTVYSIGLITYFISCSRVDQLQSTMKPLPETDSKAPGAELKFMNSNSQRLHRLINSCIQPEDDRVDLSCIINNKTHPPNMFPFRDTLII